MNKSITTNSSKNMGVFVTANDLDKPLDTICSIYQYSY